MRVLTFISFYRLSPCECLGGKLSGSGSEVVKGSPPIQAVTPGVARSPSPADVVK